MSKLGPVPGIGKLGKLVNHLGLKILFLFLFSFPLVFLEKRGQKSNLDLGQQKGYNWLWIRTEVHVCYEMTYKSQCKLLEIIYHSTYLDILLTFIN